MLKKLLALTCLTLSIGANAAPVIWTFDNVVYDDGSTTVGSFTYDAEIDDITRVDFVTTCGTTCAGTLVTYSFFGNGSMLLAETDDEVDYRVYNDFEFDMSLVTAGNVTSVDAGITHGFTLAKALSITGTVSTVPIPAAAWLFGSALLGLGVARRKKA